MQAIALICLYLSMAVTAWAHPDDLSCDSILVGVDETVIAEVAKIETAEERDSSGEVALPDFHARIVAIHPKLLKYAKYRLEYAEQAKDVTQDAILHALANRQKLKPNSNVEAWLFTILKNRILDHLRKKPNQKTIPLQEWHFVEKGHQVLDRLTAHTVVTKYFPLLKPELQEALYLSIFEDLTDLEIATRLGIERATARTRIFRAREDLKKLTDGEIPPAPVERRLVLKIGSQLLTVDEKRYKMTREQTSVLAVLLRERKTVHSTLQKQTELGLSESELQEIVDALNHRLRNALDRKGLSPIYLTHDDRLYLNPLFWQAVSVAVVEAPEKPQRLKPKIEVPPLSMTITEERASVEAAEVPVAQEFPADEGAVETESANEVEIDVVNDVEVRLPPELHVLEQPERFTIQIDLLRSTISYGDKTLTLTPFESALLVEIIARKNLSERSVRQIHGQTLDKKAPTFFTSAMSLMNQKLKKLTGFSQHPTYLNKVKGFSLNPAFIEYVLRLEVISSDHEHTQTLR